MSVRGRREIDCEVDRVGRRNLRQSGAWGEAESREEEGAVVWKLGQERGEKIKRRVNR